MARSYVFTRHLGVPVQGTVTLQRWYVADARRRGACAMSTLTQQVNERSNNDDDNDNNGKQSNSKSKKQDNKYE